MTVFDLDQYFLTIFFIICVGCAGRGSTAEGARAASGVVEASIGGAVAWSGLVSVIGSSYVLISTSGDDPSPSKKPAIVYGGIGVTLLTVGATLLFTGASTVAGAIPAQHWQPNNKKPSYSIPVQTVISKECKACPDKCLDLRRSCDSGSIDDCQRAGACVCGCKIENGGCGESLEDLNRCVFYDKK